MRSRGWLFAGLALVFAAGAMVWLVRSMSEVGGGATRITWRGAEGVELAGLGGCDNLDNDFVTLVHDGRVWTSCGGLGGGSSLPHGAYAAVDPDKAEGLVAWPLPEDLGLTFTRALAPGEGGFLGIVYMAGGMGKGNAKLVAAIAGPSGWAREPVVIFESASAVLPDVLLGLAWAAPERLEVALGGVWTNEDERWRIVTIEPNSEPSEQTLPAERFCTEDATCRAHAALWREHWDLLVERRIDDERTLEWVPVVPAGTPRGVPDAVLESLPGLTGLAAAGLLTDNAFDLQRELTADGELVAVAKPPEGWEKAARWKGHYERRGDRLRRVERWLIPDEGEVARELGDGVLAWRCEVRDDELHVVLERTSPADRREQIGPRVSRRACAGLARAELVVTSDGGALVDVAGRVVHLETLP